MSDNNRGKLFRNIPKLNGKENFVEWDQQLRLTLPIAKGGQFTLRAVSMCRSNNMDYPEGMRPKARCDTLGLLGSLYGMKQCGRTWWIELGKGLEALGFKRTESDWGLYYRTGSSIVFATVSTVLQLMSKWGVTRKATSDDFVAIVAWMFAVGVAVSIMIGTQVGLGAQWYDPLRPCAYAFTILYNPALMTTRTTILIMYHHIAAAHPFLRRCRFQCHLHHLVIAALRHPGVPVNLSSETHVALVGADGIFA
ncbi:hypothetical protein JCM24511_02064 [Saitozyma sp. JCM 24511]|nr:hypothetical protein JCM24511_02064 [Saitozyma sp. JCM 24511]